MRQALWLASIIWWLSACPGSSSVHHADGPPEAGKCSTETCSGCCIGGTCQLGSTAPMCGIGGLPCVQCQTGETCANGQCVAGTSCSPGSCTGCCSADTCLPGTDDAACGIGGLFCTHCDPDKKCLGGACSAPGTCSTSNCTGCCSGSDCKPGTDASFCGQGGVPCKGCLAATCVQGACVSTPPQCSSANCSGCCSGTDCKAGTSTSLCGQGGQACKACTGSQLCSQGTCSTPPCGPGTCAGCCQGTTCATGASTTSCGLGGGSCKTCGQHQVCQGGSCVLDPASQWKVTAKRANLEPSKSWDPIINTAPDAFVKVTLGSQTGQTPNLSNTYTPVWNADLFTASAASLVSLKMTAEVYDSDWPSGDDLIGSCSISVTASDLLAGTKTVYNCDTNKYILLLEFAFTAM